MTIKEWLTSAEETLKDTPDPRSDAIWICEECLDIPRARLRMAGETPLTAERLAKLDAALARRLQGEPVQYIFSRAPFMGYEFYVDPRVLIPRMDTETLCDAAANYMKKRPGAKVLDLCAGSGAIGISLAKMFPTARVTLSDISPDAAEVQRINAEGVPNVEILTGDLFAPLKGRTFDVIACNPPYIRSGDMAGLQSEVRREPKLALDGGADGLDLSRRLAAEYQDHLAPGGRIYMEIGFDQGEDVRAMFPGSQIRKDLNGLDRVVWAEA